MVFETIKTFLVSNVTILAPGPTQKNQKFGKFESLVGSIKRFVEELGELKKN